MAITVPASASENVAYGSGTTMAFTRQAAHASGDILLALVYWEDGLADPTPPAGWTKVGATASNGTLRFAVYWYRDTGSGGPWTFTWGSSTNHEGLYQTFRGCKASGSPIDTSNKQSNTGSSSATGPSVTTSVVNTMLAHIAAAIGSPTFTPPAGFTEDWDVDGFEYAHKAQAAAGATGTIASSMTGSFDTEVFTVALLPVVTATTVAVNQATESDAAQNIVPVGASAIARMNNAIAANRERAQTTVHTFQRQAGKQGSFAYHNGLVFDFLAQEALAGGGVIMTQDWGVIRALRMSGAYTEL